jgi:RNase P/RNase MRP subunit p29
LDGAVLKSGQRVVYHPENSEETLTGSIVKVDSNHLMLETNMGNLKFSRHDGDIEILTTEPEQVNEKEKNVPVERGADMSR